MARPSWDRYFLDMCEAVAKRATCDRGRSGCVIVKDKQILCTGYVGSPSGQPHCDDVGHKLHKVLNEDGTVSQHCVRTIHAEQNAITQAAKFGTSVAGATLYIKMTPCPICAMLIVNAGIKRVVCDKRYHKDGETIRLFSDAGVQLDILSQEVEKYDNM